MRLRAALATLALGATLGLGGTAIASQGGPAPLTTGETVVSSAAIRVTPDNGCKPVIHRNTAHPAPGIDRVEIVKGHARLGQTPDVLRVYMTHSSPVVHVEVVPDEVMATTGITAGVSGGIGHANVYFAKGGKFVSPSTGCGQSANWWVRIESKR